MNTAPQPVYKGKVVTLYCVDRITERTYPRTVPDDPDKIKAARERTERSGDKVLRIGESRDQFPGEVPLATAKTLQQERAEKAAAKLVSANKQASTKREATKAKRAGKVKPAVQEKPPVPAKPKPAATPKFREALGRPIVCITTCKYYVSFNEASFKLGIGRGHLQYLFSTRTPPILYKGHVYDYANDNERLAKRCHRKPSGVKRQLQEPRQGRKVIPSRPCMLIETGAVYDTAKDMAEAFKFHHRRLHGIEVGEVRKTPAGNVRLATQEEVRQWKLAPHGGQMQIAFNQSR